MKRQDLVGELRAYVSDVTSEVAFIEKFIALLDSRERCFYRDCFDPGHVTGSALLIAPDRSKVLLNHHKIFDRWMHFGGHADGDEDIRNVALREAFEESGIEGITFVDHEIFDIDIHPIAANAAKNEPEHAHFDIVFLLQAPHERYTMSSESNQLRWCTFDEAAALCSTGTDLRMIRMLEKWKANQG